MGSYDTAKHVYDMGVRWTPTNSFPSFVVSLANAKSTSHAIGRALNTKKKPSHTKTNKSSTILNSESLGDDVRVSTPLTAASISTGKKGHTDRQSERQVTGKQTLTLTKTLSPFPIVTSSSCQYSTHAQTSTGKIPPIKLHNQGLLATKREFSHLLRHKRSVSFHSGRPGDFRYESLCLEGHSATTEMGGETEEDTTSDPATTDTRCGSRPPVKIAGPWIT